MGSFKKIIPELNRGFYWENHGFAVCRGFFARFSSWKSTNIVAVINRIGIFHIYSQLILP